MTGYHGELRIFAETRMWSDHIEIGIASKSAAGFAAAKLSFEPVVDPGSHVEPTMRLDRRVAQELFNALYALGLRPHDGAGTEAHVTAMKDHLADMRRLVFERKG